MPVPPSIRIYPYFIRICARKYGIRKKPSNIRIQIFFATLSKWPTVKASHVVLLSVRVEFAGSKIAITTANFGGLKNNLYPIAALKLGFMMICAISPYSIPVKS